MNTINLRALSALFTSTAGLFVTVSCWAGIPVMHWTQASGVQVYLVESPSVPMVDVRIELDAGSRRDPVSQSGLASVMSASTADGVRATAQEPALDENALAEAWADLGASFAGNANNDRLSFSLRSLTYPDLLEKAVALAARQLGEPAFPTYTWARDRPKWIASLKEDGTRPASVAAKAFAKAVYGAHPYGAQMTEATLTAIDVQDMAALHTRAVHPCNAKVTVVGALSRTQTDTLVTHLFARLPNTACPSLPAMPEVPALERASELDIPFASAQAQVLLGQPGYKRSDPDHFALMVGNHILGGGGFASRLTEQVREKRGLSYSVYSHFDPGLHAGAFTIGLQTRPDQAQQALALARDVLTQFVAKGPSAKELLAAKSHLIGGFPLLLDSNQKLLDNVANIAWNGLPLDYLDTWTQRVQRLTVQDIRSAFARKLQPEKMVTVVLGADGKL